MATFSPTMSLSSDRHEASRQIEQARLTQHAAEAEEHSNSNMYKTAASVTAIVLGLLAAGLAIAFAPITAAVVIATVGSLIALTGLVALACFSCPRSDVVVVEGSRPRRWWVPSFFYPNPVPVPMAVRRPVVIPTRTVHTPHVHVGAGHVPAYRPVVMPTRSDHAPHVHVGAGHVPTHRPVPTRTVHHAPHVDVSGARYSPPSYRAVPTGHVRVGAGHVVPPTVHGSHVGVGAGHWRRV